MSVGFITRQIGLSFNAARSVVCTDPRYSTALAMAAGLTSARSATSRGTRRAISVPAAHPPLGEDRDKRRASGRFQRHWGLHQPTT